MTWSDERIARAFRAADPARTPIDAGARPDAEPVRDRIMRRSADAPASSARPRIRTRLVAPLLAAAALVVVLVLALPFGVPTAHARTPAALRYVAVDATVDEVIGEAVRLLTRGVTRDHSERGSVSLGWYMDATVGNDTDRVVITPHRLRVAWNQDLSGEVTTTAGIPYFGGATGPAPDLPPAAIAPGTLLARQTYGPGEYRARVSSPPGDTADDMRALLSSYGAEPGAGALQTIAVLGSIFSDWTLSDVQQAALLDVLSTEPGLSVAGQTVDRSGRSVTALRAVSASSPYAVYLLLSRTTGRIVGSEDVLREAVSDPDLPEGAVTAYTLWDVDEEGRMP